MLVSQSRLNHPKFVAELQQPAKKAALAGEIQEFHLT
jgi:hypothetical protein